MKIFGEFKKDVKRHHAQLLKFIKRLESDALKKGNTVIIKLLQQERDRIEKSILALNDKSKELYPLVQTEVKNKTSKLLKKVTTLTKKAESLTSNNFLLEYKKKDLLLLTNKLEEAYDEISLKNKELIEKQKLIEIQTASLNKVHQEILAKNQELETQKESILDQSDYLHEANQTITFMHEKLENQNNEIRQKNDELVSINNEKNNLISIVAHDLKSPLNQIRGILTLMKVSESNSEEMVSYISMIEGCATRLSDMTGKILDVEAIDAQNLNLKLEPIDFSHLMNSVADRYLLSAKQKDIKIERNIQPNLFVLADAGFLDQIAENLASNAIKFSPSHKKIVITLSNSKNIVTAQIRDEGPGLNDEDKSKLFGKYQKLSAKPTGNETSTGLGLSIVKKFVVLMKGDIWCESEPGKGASFFVSFNQLQS